MLTLFEQALVVHLVADWLLQNSWMAHNKGSLKHPASWVHGMIHGVGLGLVLGVAGGVVLGLVHMLIDTRVPLSWWMRHIKDSQGDDDAKTIAVWADQVIHITAIAVWVWLKGL